MTTPANNNEYVTLAEAKDLVPGGCSLSTINRYVLKGVRGCKLETIVRGGRRFTTRAMIDAFVSSTTAASK